MKKILFCLLAFYTPVSIVIAQNTTNSPTSMFGLGELSTGEGGQYAGLGGTGIALREGKTKSFSLLISFVKYDKFGILFIGGMFSVAENNALKCGIEQVVRKK